MSGAAWMAGQLVRMSDGRSAMRLELPRDNPRPPGVVREGSATDDVLRVLSEHPTRYFTYGELRTRCPSHSHAALSWGLLRARRFGLVLVLGDESRNARYLRYRIKG